MPRMLLSRPFRRFVACAAAAMLLACQGMAIAGASALPQADATAPAAPCHDAGSDAGKSTGGTCPAQCEYQNASSTPSKVVYSTVDLPEIMVAFDRFSPVLDSAPPVVSWLERIEPPPLRTLNCCLRN